jgi:hypothetical protein
MTRAARASKWREKCCGLELALDLPEHVLLSRIEHPDGAA